MKLYLISQEENSDYDTYDSAVVCAPDEETARHMDPSTGKPCDWGNTFSCWASRPEKVRVEYIGEATPDTPVGVICASFNAG